MHVAAGGDLADHEALHFALAQDVHDVLAGGRDGHAGCFASFGELYDAHVLRVEGVFVAVGFEEDDSDGRDADERQDC